MPLPFKIGSPPTVDFSDYKNSYQAVYNAIIPMRNSTSDGSLTLGHSNEYVDWKFDPGEAVGNKPPLLRAYIHADKVGSPTFNISLNLYADDGSGNPDLNNKLSSGVTVPASIFPATARLVQFSFLLPVAVLNGTNYHAVFKASAQGDASNHVRIYKDSGGSLIGANSSNAGTRAFGSSTWTYPGMVDIIRGALYLEDNQEGSIPPLPPRLWAVALDKTNNKIRIYKSTDGGATWSEISASGAPSCSTTSGLKSIQIQEGQTSLYEPRVVVASNTGTVDATFSTHRIIPGASSDWGSEAGGSLVNLKTDVAGNTPRGFGRRSNADLFITNQGLEETVMGSARRRIKLQRFPTGFGNVDVVGSVNSPVGATQPGTATHYDLRLAFMDAEDRFHIFYSSSDNNNIQHRVLNADDTFSTINQIGATPAVCSNTSAYPIGLGCNYYKNNEWRIAIMYLDSTSGTIKVAHCKASDSATASAWTIEQISTDTPEVTTSNLGFLSPDSQQSGQLIAFYVKSDDTLWMTKDNGTGTWNSPIQWRSGQAIAGISGFLTARNLNIMQLNTAPTPDELQLDRL